jgi:hypothetical protein
MIHQASLKDGHQALIGRSKVLDIGLVALLVRQRVPGHGRDAAVWGRRVLASDRE